MKLVLAFIMLAYSLFFSINKCIF